MFATEMYSLDSLQKNPGTRIDSDFKSSAFF